VHAVLFVHRVTGLPAGLYFLVRNEDHFSELKNSMSSNFAWAKPEGCPDDLPLYELDKSLFDSKSSGSRLSEKLSCHQVCHIVNGFIILNVPYFGRVVQRLIKQKKKKKKLFRDWEYIYAKGM
jgi:hypothetical protein